jgi:hypothetical protein
VAENGAEEMENDEEGGPPLWLQKRAKKGAMFREYSGL